MNFSLLTFMWLPDMREQKYSAALQTKRGSLPHAANVHKWFGMQSAPARRSLTPTEMFYIELKLT